MGARPVVVGVDGSEESLSAVGWAARNRLAGDNDLPPGPGRPHLPRHGDLRRRPGIRSRR
jgi:hypothetical protein